MKSLFWKTYQVTFITSDRKLENIQFFRGFTWEVVKLAQKESKEKSTQENLEWTIKEIKRI
jgi:hypothetical protein